MENKTKNGLIGIDTSRQTNTNIPQRINFAGKLEKIWCNNVVHKTSKQWNIKTIFNLLNEARNFNEDRTLSKINQT